jgi:hypothetical protein
VVRILTPAGPPLFSLILRRLDQDTIMIKDRYRAVKVTVIAPDDMNVLNVQELAEKAWRSVNKEITIG